MVFQIAAQRVRGASHRKIHSPCQDACGIGRVLLADTADRETESKDLIVGAVADGGGSRALSHIGARLTVSLAVSSMKLRWNADRMEGASPDEFAAYWRNLCEDCRHLLRLEAESRAIFADEAGRNAGLFACTLVAFMATPNRLAAAQVGDGFLVVGRAVEEPKRRGAGGVEYVLVFKNRETEEAGQVVWLTASNWLDDLRTTVLLGPVDFVVASSDGMEKAVLEAVPERPGELQPHYPYFEQFRTGCRQILEETRGSSGDPEPALRDYLTAVLSSPHLDDRTDDDKSMALAVWV
jgi:Protein phosphatase 2C